MHGVQPGEHGLDRLRSRLVEGRRRRGLCELAQALVERSDTTRTALVRNPSFRAEPLRLADEGYLATRDGDPAFLEAKLITARFYAEVILPPALAQLGPLKAAGRTVFALTEDQF